MISFHSLGIELTMSVNFKKWTGDGRACHNFSLWRKIPLSDVKSPIFNVSMNSKMFSITRFVLNKD